MIKARLTSRKPSLVVRRCPVAIVIHETIVTVEEEIEEAARTLPLSLEEDQDKPNKGKMP